MTLKQLLYQDFKRITLQNLPQLKRDWARQLGSVPKNSAILAAYRQLRRLAQVPKNPVWEKVLTIRQVRTLSGVAPLAIMMKPWPCPGNCIYCPQEKGMPKSYLSDEPAAARAKKLKFYPKKQLLTRLKQLENIGHNPEKLQIIVIGGTFSAYPNQYQQDFIKAIFDAANGNLAKNLLTSQNRNETAKYRIVGLSIETRPELVTPQEIRHLRRLGVTKVQLGVQILNDKIYQKINRGHTIKDVIRATRLLRHHGFKICYHLMPNLPGATPTSDLQSFKKVFDDTCFRPDTLKIYPCTVVPNTQLFQMWQAKKYHTYRNNTLIKLLLKMKQTVPSYCRIDRLLRDIPKHWIVSGTKQSNLRQILALEMKRQNRACRCIRCREVKNQAWPHKKVKLKTYLYQTIDGQEIFLSFEDKRFLFALLRLFLPKRRLKHKPVFKALEDASLVRELQVFGQQLPINQKDITVSQHQKLGKRLLAKAEILAQKAGYKKLAVIAGIGARNYYRRLGYQLQQTYMTKDFSKKRSSLVI